MEKDLSLFGSAILKLEEKAAVQLLKRQESEESRSSEKTESGEIEEQVDPRIAELIR